MSIWRFAVGILVTNQNCRARPRRKECLDPGKALPVKAAVITDTGNKSLIISIRNFDCHLMYNLFVV